MTRPEWREVNWDSSRNIHPIKGQWDRRGDTKRRGGESCVRVYVNIGNILQWFNSIIFVTM